MIKINESTQLQNIYISLISKCYCCLFTSYRLWEHFSTIKSSQVTTMADTGGLQWFQLKPPLKELATLISDD